MTGTAVVAATTRPALVGAHGDIKAWIIQRRERLSSELQEVKQALERARERKWATDTLARQVRSLEKHEIFLAKVTAALDVGYAIVPNFDLDALAVRTNEKVQSWRIHKGEQPVIGAARLPVGQGDYVSPDPELISWEEEITRADGKGSYKVTMYRTTDHAPVDVPFVLMKQELADALHAALQERIFDEIGIVRDARWGRRGDPVLVGRINHPKRTRWENRGVSFFIGWWFDVRALEA